MGPPGANTRLVGSEAVDGEGDLFVFGSADLCDSLLGAGLVDEVLLGLVPVVLGHGTPFFKPRPTPVTLEHLGTRRLGPGCTLLRYRPIAPDPA